MAGCKNCGALLDGAAVNCFYCGSDISREGVVEYHIFISDFSQRLQRAVQRDKGEGDLDNSAAISLINTIAVPASKDSLIQLAALMAGQIAAFKNISMMDVFEQQKLVGAWLGKAREVEVKIKLMASADKQTSVALDILEKAIEDTEKGLSKAQRNVWVFFGIFLSILASIFLVVYFLSD
jgi:hypothetical protein